MAKKGTKKALIASVLSMTLSASMLVGTTFAWFTDEVESGVNTIVAGNLDVELTHKGAGDTAFKKVKGATDLFQNAKGEPMLWEPNASTSEIFEVSNEGSLALKYTFSIAFSNATATPAGKTLADVLTIEVKDEDGNALADGLLKDFSYSSTLIAEASEQFEVTIAWPQSANDNAFNVKGGLKIDLGVKVLASQLSYESDGIDNTYDVNAPWTGAIDTAWYNDTDTAFEIESAEELAGLAELVNNGNDFAGKTITIVKDLDLNNINWTPIGTEKDGAVFRGDMVGAKGVEIYNLYVKRHTNAGLFGATYTNSPTSKGASITNIDIVNAYVESTHYAGAVVAWGYFSTTKGGVTGCDVYNATIKSIPELQTSGQNAGKYDNGDKAGVLVGWMACGDLTNNSATNSTVTAFRDLGGIAGHVRHEAGASVTIDVTDNKVENVTLTYYKVAGEVVDNNVNGNCGAIVGRYVDGSAYNIADNTYEKVIMPESALALVATAAELQSALDDAKDGDEIVFLNDIEGDVVATQKENVSVTINGNGYKFDGVMTVFGDGRKAGDEALTIENINFVAANGAESCIVSPSKDVYNKLSYSHNVTVANCTFTDPDGDVNCAAIRTSNGGDMNWTIEECTVDSTMHSLVQVANVEGELKITNCTINSKDGINVNQSANVIITGCIANVKGYAVRFGAGSGSTVVAEKYTIQDCTLKSANNEGDATIILRGTAAGATLNISNTTIVGTPEITNTVNATVNR